MTAFPLNKKHATPQLEPEFFARESEAVARELLGSTLVMGPCKGIIVEVEVYKNDGASHAVTRKEAASLLRTTYGLLYVYLIYGTYHCLNITTERNGPGAVLIRAVEPVAGLDLMFERRRTTKVENLTNGPGKLCEAFGITRDLHGERVGRRLRIESRSQAPPIAASPRIGISRDRDLLWRFFIPDNPFVSRQPRRT